MLLKGICDALAKAGFQVIMPDCHRGDTAEGKGDIVGWVASSSYDDVIKGDFETIMEFSANGVTSVGAIGFCWGAWAWDKAASSGIE